MGRLTLALLGSPEVRHGERLLAFRTRKTLALLIYLAVSGGTPSRDKLTALFWPESDERHGRMMLRRTLAFLRQVLGNASGSDSAHLIAGREALGLEFGPDVELDIRRLEQAASARPGQPGERDALQQAAGLYRGDFLDGFSLGDAPEFDDWASAQREYSRQQMQLVFDRLTLRQVEAGEHGAALASLARWLALDPLNETVYQRLMRLHLAGGDRPAALEAYAAVRAALAKALDIEPSPETQALADRARVATDPHLVSPRPAAHARHPALAEGPLVGRANEFSQLVAAYYAARSGKAQFVSLEGEAGIGKTRLANEFARWAAAEGSQVLKGQAFEAGGRLPYQPVVEALRAGLALEAGRPAGLGAVWLGEMAQLLPELREHHPDLPQPLQPEAAAQARLFEAIARWGEALAARAPVLLYVDDLQWADEASLDLLHYCARHWAEKCTPLLLLCTLRSDMSAPAGWLSSLQRDLPLVRLSLGPLLLDDTRRYLEALSGQAQPGPALHDFARWLFDETSGQPFFIVETLKALLAQQVLRLRPQPGGAWALDLDAASELSGLENLLAPSVRELIRGRLARLGPQAFSLLSAGAVLGHDFDFEELCAVAGQGEEVGLPAWDELLASGLLGAGSEPGAGHYRFSHDKIRDVTYTEAGEARRRIFHRRALESLEAAGAPAAELAHHAAAAGQTEAVYRHTQSAGDDAMRLFAVRDAVAHYERARRAAESLKAPVGQGQLYSRLARAYEAAGEYAQAHATYETALAIARDSGDPQLECVTLNRLATLAGIHTFDNQEVGQYLRQALRVAEASGDKLGLAETEWNLAHYAFYAGDLAPARMHCRNALALARELGAQELIARSLNVLAYIELGAHDWLAAEASAAQAQPLYAALGDRPGVADSLLQLANARLNTGRLKEGIEPARAAHKIDQEIENNWGLVLCDVHLAHGLLDAGDPAEALAVAEEGARLGRGLGMNALLIFILAALGAVHRALNNLDSARTAHLEAQAVNQKFPTQPFVELVSSELCADSALAGDWAEAGRYARQALAARGRMKVPFFGRTLWLETEALVRAGEVDAARADVVRFGQELAGSPRLRIVYLRALAVLARSDGKRDEAIGLLREAAALAKLLGLPNQEVQSYTHIS